MQDLSDIEFTVELTAFKSDLRNMHIHIYVHMQDFNDIEFTVYYIQ